LCSPRGTQSFVVVPAAVVGRVIDGTAAVTAAPTVRSPGGVERYQRRPSVGRMGLGVELRASMDDDDEFDPDAWTDELRENEGKTRGGDDMGMGVSNTVKKKRRADPKYVNAEGGENTVLELASAAQNVLDKWDEENEEEEQERKRQAEAAAAAFMVDDEEEDLGMGVSDTIPAPKSMMETLGGSDKFDKAINAMQGAEQLREMESMTARDQKRAEMEQRGLSEQQIAAYLG
ncbi:unnamed protein product, partial [Ectocarpus sp. 13 AM-2016]